MSEGFCPFCCLNFECFFFLYASSILGGLQFVLQARKFYELFGLFLRFHLCVVEYILNGLLSREIFLFSPQSNFILF